ncbi:MULTISPECIES: DUF4239 domain-containing protein [Paraburkholderia]|jgi:hypothetical protein|uniref:DUF4239 domain-containing protein n=1 Tax=Paraburkholderia phenazinium TaxID=60549 RepID=A0A1N6K3R1_9BURK|nr:DUF4239 domain-containing protein [Paraburkholderia phenazinium]SIO51195.1 Protein of unknown function [Paraburkholderia phenazinium]
MLLLYNLPTFCMAALVVGATLAAALLGYVIFRRCAPIELDAEQRAMTISMVSVITTINSLLVAFAAISVWDAYNDANRTVAAEAACAGELARDLAAFSSPNADATGRALRGYLERVVENEWPLMQQQARFDPEAEARFDAMFDSANLIQPTGPRQTTLLAEVLARANEMVKYREQRIATLDVAMPVTLWAVMIVVSLLSFLLLYALPATRFHVALTSAWAVTLGLAFFFVLAVDRPFAGDVSVSSAPFRQTIDALIARGTWPAAPIH